MGSACSTFATGVVASVARGTGNGEHAPYQGAPRVLLAEAGARRGDGRDEAADAKSDELCGFTPVEGVGSSAKHRRRKRRALWGGARPGRLVHVWCVGNGDGERNASCEEFSSSDEDMDDDGDASDDDAAVDDVPCVGAWATPAPTQPAPKQAPKPHGRRIPSLFNLAADAFVSDVLPSALPSSFAHAPLDIVQTVFDRAVARNLLDDASLSAFRGCQLIRLHVGKQAAGVVTDNWLAQLLAVPQHELMSCSLVHLPNVTGRGVSLVLQHCPKLRVLRLDGCQAGCTDASLGALASPTNAGAPRGIEKLSMAMCDHVTSAGVAALANLPNLRALNLEMCSNVSNVAVLARLRNLHVLNLSYVPFVIDSDLIELSRGLPALTELNLARTSVSDVGVKHVAAWARSLVVLSVAGCFVTNASLGAICRCSKLEVLELSWCAVDDAGFTAAFCTSPPADSGGGMRRGPGRGGRGEGTAWMGVVPAPAEPLQVDVESHSIFERTPPATPSGVALDNVDSPRRLPRPRQLPNLLRLNLAHTAVSDGTVAALRHAGASMLMELNLDSTRITAASVRMVADTFPHMRSLVLTDTLVNNASVNALRRMSKLRHLNMAYTNINDDGLTELAANVPGSPPPPLCTLRIDNRSITDDGVRALVGFSASLMHLDLFLCRVTDAGAADLAKLTKLRSLDVCSGQLTDAGVQLMAGALHNLHYLNIGHNTLLTECAVSALVAGMPELRTLNLMEAHITSSAMDKLAKLRHLRHLCIHGCRASLASVKAIQKKMPGLQVTL